MESLNCDFSPLKIQLKEDLQQLVNQIQECLDELDNEEYCLLRKFEQIRRAFAQNEATASSFYLNCYLSPFTDKYVDLSITLQNLAERRHGALIVIERSDSLDGILHSGTPIGATLSHFLLESIFAPGSPLHDGAVLIRSNQIVSAANVLPLSNAMREMEKLGTRHRAALGLTECSDALVLVVSEETGKASFALSGRLYPIVPFGFTEVDLSSAQAMSQGSIRLYN
ncbi:sporulation-specific diadenylate cyclase CdaS [Ammoniphilus sp. YIM 78166]|uniref:sporulation-specific diadenylate cyclase CdaS n=1 Tax=Ammoniphilus sp. YIM 78166 TaxID=1644106 RepID=UPI00107061E7|nr:sporulation-specific diadenylate cyclase CdaS [Ammoniphilus sp. YIM 78166]